MLLLKNQLYKKRIEVLFYSIFLFFLREKFCTFCITNSCSSRISTCGIQKNIYVNTMVSNNKRIEFCDSDLQADPILCASTVNAVPVLSPSTFMLDEPEMKSM